MYKKPCHHLIFLIITVYYCLLDEAKSQKITISTIAKMAVKMHNVYRVKHQAPKLVPSETLNSYAKECAAYYAERGDIDHSCPLSQEFGENLHMGDAEGYEEDFVKEAIDGWYEEQKDYPFNNTQNLTQLTNSDGDLEIDHFTQMVWQETKLMGFGTAVANDNIVAVALYSPQGNVEGEYKKNVKKAVTERPSAWSSLTSSVQKLFKDPFKPIRGVIGTFSKWPKDHKRNATQTILINSTITNSNQSVNY